jgi:hypothetical protein
MLEGTYIFYLRKHFLYFFFKLPFPCMKEDAWHMGYAWLCLSLKKLKIIDNPTPIVFITEKEIARCIAIA